jgi:hypothetical protein
MEIEEEFDSIKHVDRKFYKLRQLVNELKICSSNKCEIFTELTEIDNKRIDFEEYKTLKEARDNITRKAEIKQFETDYREYIALCKAAFSFIYRLKVSKDGQIADFNRKNIAYIEVIDAIGKAKINAPLNMLAGLQKETDKLGAFTIGLTDDEKKDVKKTREFVAKQKKTSKKKKPKKAWEE